jgi:hypothetical protein
MNRLLISVSLLSLFVAFGCGGSATSSNSLTGSSAQLREVKGSGDVSGFDVQLDGRLFLGATAKTAYKAVNLGSHTLDVTMPGATTALASVPTTFSASTNQTLVVAGATEDQSLTAFLVTDDPTAPPTGQLKLRFVHSAHVIGRIDIYVADASATFPMTPTFANVDYKTATATLTRPASDFKVCWVPYSPLGGIPGIPQCPSVLTIKVGGATPMNSTFFLADPAIDPSAPPGTFSFAYWDFVPN